MNHLLYCSSAGHEPELYLSAETEEFEEIEVRGRVLGQNQNTRYHQQKVQLISMI